MPLIASISSQSQKARGSFALFEAASSTARRVAWWGLGTGVVVAAALLAARPVLAPLFTDDPAVLMITYQARGAAGAGPFLGFVRLQLVRRQVAVERVSGLGWDVSLGQLDPHTRKRRGLEQAVDLWRCAPPLP